MTCLEQLPDELLLELFEKHVRVVDLYVGFVQLRHRRFTAILNSARVFVDIPGKDVFHAPSFAHFARQIVSLRVSMFCGKLDLTTLDHLRGLHIEKPTREQLVSIRPACLPQLSYLSLSPSWYHPSELPPVLRNLPQSCTFEHLRRVVLPDGRTVRCAP